MKNLLSKTLTSALSGVLAIAVSTSVFSAELNQIANGMPEHVAEGLLPKEQYAVMEVAKLKNAKLVWANLNLLRDMGYQVPEKIDAATEKALLESLAWVAPDERVSDAEITSERKTMVADYYGGTGIGYNLGSARAASAGRVQLKGVGITPLHMDTNKKKYSARSTVHEAIKDALWGEVLNNELPYGANRIVAIIDRGGSLENGEPQIIEVRVDPVRMGHFVRRSFGTDEKDKRRAAISAEHLLESLPIPEGEVRPTQKGERFVQGMKEFSRRIAVQYATMHMRRLFHGATSASNIEINGRMIDFGTASAQPAYEKISFLSHVEPFGETFEIKKDLLQRFVQELILSADLEKEVSKQFQDPQAWKSELRTELVKIFSETYELERARQALILSGVPEEIVKGLLKRHQSLASQLVRLTHTESQSEIVSLQQVSTLRNRAQSQLEVVFNTLARVHDLANKSEIEKAFVGVSIYPLPGAEEFANFFDEAAKQAERGGVVRERFFEVVRTNAHFANRPVEELYLPDLKKNTTDITQEYMNGQTEAARLFIQTTRYTALRSAPGLKWYEAPVSMMVATDGRAKLRVYDASTGKTSLRPFEIRDRHFQGVQPASRMRSRPAMCRQLFAS